MIRAILTDLEGTTTRIAFVHDVLFPYARAALPALLRDRAADPEIAAVLDEVRAAAPGVAPLDTLLGWMDADAKAGPLKLLQGIVWQDGYAAGALRGELYPDVAPCLRAWTASGLRLAVYSSGAEAAQRLLFRHAGQGDLESLFDVFFDTRIGAKTEAASYAAIARALKLPAGAVLFLSDRETELDAARAAGMMTCQVVRPCDGTVPSVRHGGVAEFGQIRLEADVDEREGLLF